MNIFWDFKNYYLHPFTKKNRLDMPARTSRRAYGFAKTNFQFVKANGAKHQELFRKALDVFEKALSSF